MKKLFILCFIAVMAMFNSSISYCAESVFSSSTIFPIGDNQIRMMSEDTYVDLHKHNVTSEFILKNLDNSKQKLEIGFSKDFNGNTIITDVSVLVNNKKITPGTKLVDGKYVYYFDVNFSSKEYKKINLVYSGKFDENTDKVSYDLAPLQKWNGELISFKYTMDLGDYLKPEVYTYLDDDYNHKTFTDRNTYEIEYTFQKPKGKIDTEIKNGFKANGTITDSRDIYKQGKPLEAFKYLEKYVYKEILKKTDVEYNNRKPYEILNLFGDALNDYTNKGFYDKNYIYSDYMYFYLIEYSLDEYSDPKYDKDLFLDTGRNGLNIEEFIWNLQVLTETTPSRPLKGKIICIDPGHQKNANLQPEPLFPGSKETKAKVEQGGASYTFNQIQSYIIRKGGGQADPAIYSEPSELITEDQINLEIAGVLKYKLEALGATVIMTRTEDDVNISNKERAEFANAANADLTIRIHCDSSTDTTVSGISVLTPSIKNLGEKGIYSVSKLLAQDVLSALVKSTGDKDRGVIERDDLTGFNWAKYPTILVECGFLSNPDWPYYERYLYEGEGYSGKLIDGMTDGIQQYFESAQSKEYYRNHPRWTELKEFENAKEQLRVMNLTNKNVKVIKGSSNGSESKRNILIPILIIIITIVGAIVYLAKTHKHIFGKH